MLLTLKEDRSLCGPPAHCYADIMQSEGSRESETPQTYHLVDAFSYVLHYNPDIWFWMCEVWDGSLSQHDEEFSSRQ